MISVRIAKFVVGALLAGSLVGEAVYTILGIRPGIQRKPVIGLTLPRSSSPTPTVTSSGRADMPSAPAVSAAPGSNEGPKRSVRALTSVAPTQHPTPEPSIEHL